MVGLTLAERGALTETTAIRYQLASKRGKGTILDELCTTPDGMAVVRHSGSWSWMSTAALLVSMSAATAEAQVNKRARSR